MERYYALRDAPGNRPETVDRQEFLVYDHPRLQQGWLVRKHHHAEAEFLVDGIACAACVWLIEHWLSRLPGVESVHVNFSTHRLGIRWDPSRTRVSDLLMAVHRVGYRALPYTREARRSLEESQRRELLKRVGVAAALGMQVMVISVALYAGDWFGIEPALADFLRRVNLLLALRSSVMPPNRSSAAPGAASAAARRAWTCRSASESAWPSPAACGQR